jgi:hypothetical protein
MFPPQLSPQTDPFSASTSAPRFNTGKGTGGKKWGGRRGSSSSSSSHSLGPTSAVRSVDAYIGLKEGLAAEQKVQANKVFRRVADRAGAGRYVPFTVTEIPPPSGPHFLPWQQIGALLRTLEPPLGLAVTNPSEVKVRLKEEMTGIADQYVLEIERFETARREGTEDWKPPPTVVEVLMDS